MINRCRVLIYHCSTRKMARCSSWCHNLPPLWFVAVISHTRWTDTEEKEAGTRVCRDTSSVCTGILHFSFHNLEENVRATDLPCLVKRFTLLHIKRYHSIVIVNTKFKEVYNVTMATN